MLILKTPHLFWLFECLALVRASPAPPPVGLPQVVKRQEVPAPAPTPPAVPEEQRVSAIVAAVTAAVGLAELNDDTPPVTEYVTTIVNDETTATVTYVPTTITGESELTLTATDGTSVITSTATEGDGIWVAIAAGAAAALVPAILLPGVAGVPPEPVEPDPVDPPDDGCESSTFSVCTVPCSEDYYAEDYEVKTTTMCEPQSCAVSTACDATDTTTTVTRTDAPPEPLATNLPENDIIYDDEGWSEDFAAQLFGDFPVLITQLHDLLNVDSYYGGPIPPPECNTTQTLGADGGELQENAADWCKKYQSSAVDPNNNGAPYGAPIDDTYIEEKARSIEVTFNVDYDMSRPDECSTDFVNQYFIDINRCQSLFNSIINSCDTDTATNKHGGRNTDGCAIYSIELADTTQVQCDGSVYSTSQGFCGKSFERAWAEDAINQFCDDDSLYLDPEVDEPDPGEFSESGTPGWPDMAYPEPSMDDPQAGVHVKVSFFESLDPPCPAPQRVNLKDIPECKDILMRAIDGCNTDTDTKKFGGTVTERSSGGCLQWSVYSPGGETDNTSECEG